MPIPTTSKLPKPKSAEEFEDIAVDFLRVRWKDPHATRHGRSGQRQNGVDVIGHPPWLKGTTAGAQCKNTDSLTLAIVMAEVEEAKTFAGGLGEYLMLTTGDRDATLQADVREHFRANPAPFHVEVVFWGDIVADIAQDETIVAKHWKGFPSAEPGLDGFRRHAQASQHDLSRRVVAACREIEASCHRGVELWVALTLVPGNDLQHGLGRIRARLRELTERLPAMVAELEALFGKGAAAPLHYLKLLMNDLTTGIMYEMGRGIHADSTNEIIDVFRERAGYRDIDVAKRRVSQVVDLVAEWAGPYLGTPGAILVSVDELLQRSKALIETGEHRDLANVCEPEPAPREVVEERADFLLAETRRQADERGGSIDAVLFTLENDLDRAAARLLRQRGEATIDGDQCAVRVVLET